MDKNEILKKVLMEMRDGARQLKGDQLRKKHFPTEVKPVDEVPIDAEPQAEEPEPDDGQGDEPDVLEVEMSGKGLDEDKIKQLVAMLSADKK